MTLLVVYVTLVWMDELLNVVHHDSAMLVVNKPAGLVCHPTKGDASSSLIGRLRLFLGDEAKPQLVNRLDRETSGLTLAALTTEAARQLRRLWEDRQAEKEYLAIVRGWVADEAGSIDAALGRDEKSIVAIKDCVKEGGMAAVTEYTLVKRFERAEGRFSLLKVRPRTGRKHQIRIHLAYIGHPVVGDKIYGGDESLYLGFVERRLTAEQWSQLILPHHALHAGRLRFGWNGLAYEFSAPPEDWFRAFAGLE